MQFRHVQILIGGVAVALIALLGTSIPQAVAVTREEGVRVETKTEVRGENQVMRQESSQEMRTTIQGNAQDRRTRIAENHANRLEQRFGVYYTRLANIAARLEQRIAVLKGQGKNVARAEASLTTGKAALAEAQKLSAEAVVQFRAIDPAKYAEQRPAALKARDKAQAARQTFIEAKQAFQTTIQALKAVR
jgi:hypothetical protein